ncbi:MAG TPA: hypothetical protein VK642_09675 [Burkholderiales bacterium]|nr:hypothetical protein [Burkholderiales bacterium]
MKELELIITEGPKANGDAHSIELGIPVRDPVERDGEQFIVLSPRCNDVDQLKHEIDFAIHHLQELLQAAKANFARWKHEVKDK